jgi:nitrile hydratase accessory protein
MSGTIDRVIANMEDATALPRKNGELVSEAPWQGRALGIAVALYEQGMYIWDEFRDRLIVEISGTDSKAQEGEPRSTYYEQWLAAFEKLLIEKGLLSKAEIESRAAEFASGEEFWER